MDASYIYLYIDKGKGFGKTNQAWYDHLYKNKGDIERVSGGTFDWVSQPGRKSKLIMQRVGDMGLKDEASWDITQDRMVDAMSKFVGVLKPHIDTIS